MEQELRPKFSITGGLQISIHAAQAVAVFAYLVPNR
jgi:hypothetical protein